MNAAALLQRCQADGLELALEPPDTIVVRGPTDVSSRYLPGLKANKPEILRLLASPPHRLWTITELNGDAWTSSFTPPQTRAEVQARYPGAAVEPADTAPPEPDPLPALYHRWLAGIDEPRALLTLNDVQVQEAVAAGIVTRTQAQASVLLLVRSPAGDLGPGAAGLLAVPKARYRDFSPSAAIEALQAWH